MPAKEFSYTLTGTQPLMMHSVGLANPFNEIVTKIKAITDKGIKKRTEDDTKQLMWLEWLGGQYFGGDDGNDVVIPAKWLRAVIREGAKKARKGKDAQAGVRIYADAILKHDGPRDPAERFKDSRYVSYEPVRIKGSGIVMRTRALFPNWSVTFSGILDTEVLSKEALNTALNIAGQQVGMGDYRPIFGLFVVKENGNRK